MQLIKSSLFSTGRLLHIRTIAHHISFHWLAFKKTYWLHDSLSLQATFHHDGFVVTHTKNTHPAKPHADLPELIPSLLLSDVTQRRWLWLVLSKEQRWLSIINYRTRIINYRPDTNDQYKRRHKHIKQFGQLQLQSGKSCLLMFSF